MSSIWSEGQEKHTSLAQPAILLGKPSDFQQTKFLDKVLLLLQYAEAILLKKP
jgi:hypothetical protein